MIRYIFSGLVLLNLQTVYAANSVRGACKAEIKKFTCDDKSDAYAFDCLKENNEASIKNKGFSPKCFKAYASYEKESGKGEKIDSHQTEQLEHKH